MAIIKSLKKRYNWLSKVRFDKSVGFYKYKLWESIIFIKHPRDYTNKRKLTWLCENLYFHHYHPKHGDTIVDFGAGYGEEGVYLKNYSGDFRYVGVEIQPIIYECLCNTYFRLGKEFTAVPYVIGDTQKKIKVASQFSYASSRVTNVGYIEVPIITWTNFLSRYQIDKIDLLKINIEGAESLLLSQIIDFSKIKRIIVSCHDFRAESGDGEFFRTKKDVLKILAKNNFKVKTFSLGINWADDWIYAEFNSG